MIQFLKESTFAVNEVFNKSLELLKRHYFSVAGLCFLLFVTSGLSNYLATTISDFNVVLSGFMAFFFMVMYFGLNMTLFKYILSLIDGNQEKKLVQCIPSTKELAYFFGAMLSIMVLSIALLMLLGAVSLPFLYLFENGDNRMELMSNFTMFVVFVAAILTFILIIRVAFYPFFIIDKHAGTLRSLRFSFALTKGNVFKLLLILAVFAFFQLLQMYFNYLEYYIIFIILNLVSSFLVVPLASIVVSVAYRSMMADYHGEKTQRF
ncbi:HRD ubiquitin ligase complex, ER membrane component [Sphingobacterium multivorum]|uniref:HRD ubiquitin ligase complex, ER membrane component n=1 Tax=Sphingobacterium multivorum TaxID=28454 RepID=A0A2X2LIT5_SPHMU|nr:beta-carotene 15,15'-monooxygenase [Sphingobacterium multivorum]SPZ93159.1 HRD ubiquitin ligase complex, ER membrane component [Sphingobacterium multivorum]